MGSECKVGAVFGGRTGAQECASRLEKETGDAHFAERSINLPKAPPEYVVRRVFEKPMRELTNTVCNSELSAGYVTRGRSAVGQNGVDPSDEAYFAPVYSEYVRSCAEALKKLETEKKAGLETGRYHIWGYPVGATVQVCTAKMDLCGFDKPTLEGAVKSLKKEGYKP